MFWCLQLMQQNTCGPFKGAFYLEFYIPVLFKGVVYPNVICNASDDSDTSIENYHKNEEYLKNSQ